MEVLLKMDNGEEFVIAMSFEEFNAVARDESGNLVNRFIKVQPGTWINPIHVTSIKKHY